MPFSLQIYKIIVKYTHYYVAYLGFTTLLPTNIAIWMRML